MTSDATRTKKMCVLHTSDDNDILHMHTIDLCRQIKPSRAYFYYFSTGQSAEIGTLTSGGPGGARTHDILLKRSIQPILSALPTSIAVRVQRLTIAYLLGGVAVKVDRQNQALPATATTELATNVLRSLSRPLASTASHPTLGGSANV